MPILDTTAWGTTTDDPAAPPVKPKARTGFMDGLAATWQQESVWVQSKVRPSLEYPDDHSFDFKTYDKNLWPLVSQARNRDHADALVAQWNQEQANKAKLDNQSWVTGLGQAAIVGLTNPLNFIGLGAAATVGRAALKAAGGAVIGTALTEPLLQSQQVNRTIEESLMNLGGAAVGGAALGAGFKALGNKWARGGFGANEGNLPSPLTPVNEALGFGSGQSVGAAQATTRTMADAKVARLPEWMTRFAVFGDFSRSANQRLSTSSLVSSRNAANLLVRQNIATEANLAGTANAVPIEVAVGQRFGEQATKLMQADNNLRSAWWNKVEGGTYDRAAVVSELRKIDPSLPADYKLTETSFDKVLKAYMADDKSFGASMPEIADRVAVGAKLRESLDADKIDFGLADKTQLEDIATGKPVIHPDQSGLKGAALAQAKLDFQNLQVSSKTHRFRYQDGSHYLSRVFDKARIMYDRNGFQDALIEGWKARNPDMNLTDPDLFDGIKQAAETVVGKILNEENAASLGDILASLDATGAYAKLRTLAIDDRYLVNWTHDNVLATELHHINAATVDTELAKAGLKWSDLKSSVDAELASRTEEIKAKLGDTAKARREISALRTEAEKDVAELEYAMRRLKRQAVVESNPALRSIAAGIGRLNKLSGMAQLGSSAIPNSLGDMASIARNFGTGRATANTLRGLFSAEFRADMRANAQALGVMHDLIDTQIRQLHIDEMATQSLDPNKGFKSVGWQRVDNGLDRANDVFAKVSLIEPWSKVGRTIASTSSAQHVIDQAAKGWKNLSKTSQMDLAKFYIDEAMLGRINGQVTKYADDVHGFKFAALEKWDDQEAARIFKSSVYAHTEHALNLPSIGSGSAFMSDTIWGRVFTRFKTFNNASHEATFLASLQNREVSRVVTGTLNYAAWGMLGVYLYDLATGRDHDFDHYFGDSEKSTKTMWKILTKAGYFAAAQDAFVTGAKALGDEKNPYRDTFKQVFPEGLVDEIFPKYKDVTAAEKLLGPTYGYVSKAIEAAWGAADGKLTEKEIGALRAEIPGQNIGWLRRGLDYVEEYLGGRKADRFEGK